MPKNIVLCSDGTGNSIGKGRGTNVARIYEALDLYGHRDDPGLRPQLALHDDGVGTQDFALLRLLAGAFGWGLARNVRELYTALCRWYEPGDAIYLFGFSRGAFTVRTLAGLIAECGVIDRRRWQTDAELRRLVRHAYARHRMRYESRLFRTLRRALGLPSAASAAQRFRLENGVQHWTLAPGGEVEVRFVGVWDTVDAVGFPVAHLAGFWNTCVFRFKFPDRRLAPNVRKACHALAIDDERRTFHPVMWDERREENGRIEQVWFAGAHSNVGGGYPKEGMSLVALDWMMTRAREQGLRFSPRALEDYRSRQNVNDRLYDARRGLAAWYRYAPRDIARLCRDNGIRPRIHASVFERVARATDGYAPANLSGAIEVVDTTPAPRADAELQARVNQALAEGRVELNRAWRWAALRSRLHYLLLAAGVGLLVSAPGQESSLGSSPLSLFLLATALGSYLLSRLARARIAATSSSFWRRALAGAAAGSPSAPPRPRRARRIPGLMATGSERAFQRRGPAAPAPSDAPA